MTDAKCHYGREGRHNTILIALCLKISGQVPEWSKGADLRSASESCVGSNPTLFTTVGRLIHTANFIFIFNSGNGIKTETKVSRSYSSVG